MKLKVIWLLCLMVIVVAFGVMYAAGSFIYNGIHNKITDTKSMVIYSGVIGSDTTMVSSAYSLTKYRSDYADILPYMFHSTTILTENVTDTVNVKILESVSVDNGSSWAVIDTIATITQAGGYLFEKELNINAIYDQKRIIIQTDTTASDSIQFRINAIYNYKKK